MTRFASFLDRAPACAHAVQIYREPGELAASLGAFLDAGFEKGEPAVVIATAARWPAFAQALEARSRPVDELERTGLLTRADAAELLDRIVEGGRPSAERFEEVVGELLERVETAFPGRTVRAFGEMVDVLWHDGRREAALELEELWNDLSARRRFALLCGYQLDILDLDVQTGALPDVLRVHSHARTVARPSRFSAAVDRALSELVPAPRAARIYLDVADGMPHGDEPRGQAVLAWLSAHEPPLAREVLGRVRAHLSPA